MADTVAVAVEEDIIMKTPVLKAVMVDLVEVVMVATEQDQLVRQTLAAVAAVEVLQTAPKMVVLVPLVSLLFDTLFDIIFY